MSNLLFHAQEISKAMEPAYDRGTPAKAVDGLIEYYYRLSEADKDQFVAALIGELVTLKTAAKHRRIDIDEYRKREVMP